MRTPLIIVAAVALSACDVNPQSVVDQCLRPQLFEQCMRALPAGPVATHYNDWDEVVDSCRDYSLYGSYRRPEHVKPECRP
jgi:hypothetical protein